jgi:hypothetical protein
MKLKDQLIRLGSQSPELRKHIRPVLDKLSGLRGGKVAKKHVKEKLMDGLRKKGPGHDGVRSVKVKRGPKTRHDGKVADYFTVTMKHEEGVYHHFLEHVRNQPDYDYEEEVERQTQGIGHYVAVWWSGKYFVKETKPRKTVWTFILPRK